MVTIAHQVQHDVQYYTFKNSYKIPLKGIVATSHQVQEVVLVGEGASAVGRSGVLPVQVEAVEIIVSQQFWERFTRKKNLI